MIPKASSRVGIHYASEQCHDLLEHKVRGIHFYTLNAPMPRAASSKALV